MQRMSGQANSTGQRNADSTHDSATGVATRRGMILPFQPLAMAFDSVNYYVDMPAVRIPSLVQYNVLFYTINKPWYL